jgi:hypothetical protein
MGEVVSKLRIAQSDWVIEGRTLKKQIGYFGLVDDQSEHTLQLHVDASPNPILGGYHTHVCVLIHPNFFVRDPGFAPAQLATEDLC